ncbi:MAG: endonuclease domain-containing protein [Agrococcus casei]|uniref:endonuclease domain-containing protein n=1 Tax=Agrococcus casei TaxID=343512 RepID=UPI003F9AB479
MGDALLTMLECRPGWELTAAMDSLLNQQRTTASALWDLLGHRGEKAVKALSQMDERRESGSETRFQLALESERISYQMQVKLLGYRVDTLIGRRLIVELGGWSVHGTRTAFEYDRERDRRLTAAGFRVIRLTYRQTMEQLEAAMADISTLVRRREHLKRVWL